MENNEDMSDNGGSGSIRPLVDHTYRDFSLYLQHAGQVPSQKKPVQISQRNFIICSLILCFRTLLRGWYDIYAKVLYSLL